MVAATLLSPVGILAVFAKSVFWTMAFICVAIFFPPYAVASVYGIGGTGFTVGSVISTWAVGRTLDLTHSYVPLFIGIGLLMPVALPVGFQLMGRVEPIASLQSDAAGPAHSR